MEFPDRSEVQKMGGADAFCFTGHAREAPFLLTGRLGRGEVLHAHFHAPALHLHQLHLPAIPSLSTLSEGRDEDVE